MMIISSVMKLGIMTDMKRTENISLTNLERIDKFDDLDVVI